MTKTEAMDRLINRVATLQALVSAGAPAIIVRNQVRLVRKALRELRRG